MSLGVSVPSLNYVNHNENNMVFSMYTVLLFGFDIYWHIFMFITQERSQLYADHEVSFLPTPLSLQRSSLPHRVYIARLLLTYLLTYLLT